MSEKNTPENGPPHCELQPNVVPQSFAIRPVFPAFQAGGNSCSNVGHTVRAETVDVLDTLALQTLQLLPGFTWCCFQKWSYCDKKIGGDAGARMAHERIASRAGPVEF